LFFYAAPCISLIYVQCGSLSVVDFCQLLLFLYISSYHRWRQAAASFNVCGLCVFCVCIVLEIALCAVVLTDVMGYYYCNLPCTVYCTCSHNTFGDQPNSWFHGHNVFYFL